MLKFSNLSYSKQRLAIIVAFSFIPLALLITFAYLPVINMFKYSFSDWNGYSKRLEYVGFENYIKIFTDPEYFSVFKVSLYYFVATFVQMGLALYFATILSFQTWFKNFFKGVLFFPSLMNGVAIGFIFLFFFKPDGTLDTLLQAVGLGSYVKLWLGNPEIINISLAGTSIWRYMGFNFIVFLGAISSISSDLYEAADIDGANRWHQFRSIILPSIKRILQLNLILAISGAVSAFDIPYIMTGGSNGSETFVIQTLDVAFKYSKVGLASAMAVVLLLIVIAVTLLQRLLIRGEED
ncbi:MULTISPECIES: carbohydrate ABC transporter permease [Paenibacillus]|jgi:multiple sugar transport system permease protein|uniref:ABC transporter permease n=2 Tax=Paenibacillus TaxID=44249 RepID=A0AAJ3J3T8_PAEPO|nr:MULTISPECIES: sugar ABC transporter permease [Paenibacillus]ALA44435.1 ABC transporter permease [Paenibacillus peoriae]APB73773.1 sn-glycerol-3-phosphate ABC transporter permease UgpA [Paenibacillus polymyxa]APQ61723.1 ABC transporter permease [Paenibacillus polymyxa]MBP1173623.1 multiple sugar transport system permease protein [Paenibacillus sp. PvR133]MCP3745649.1 sugar ABC transporter permease [Paenibacillus sp. A3M_27_13]